MQFIWVVALNPGLLVPSPWGYLVLGAGGLYDRDATGVQRSQSKAGHQSHPEKPQKQGPYALLLLCQALAQPPPPTAIACVSSMLLLSLCTGQWPAGSSQLQGLLPLLGKTMDQLRAASGFLPPFLHSLVAGIVVPGAGL